MCACACVLALCACSVWKTGSFGKGVSENPFSPTVPEGHKLRVTTPEIRADFWEGDATKHFAVKKRGFQ